MSELLGSNNAQYKLATLNDLKSLEKSQTSCNESSWF